MKSFVSELKKKSIGELEKEIVGMRNDIAKIQLEAGINPPKDTNSIYKKKKRLAQILTLLSQKKKSL